MRRLEYPPPTFVWSPARTLMEACIEAGRDDGGRHAPIAPSKICAKTNPAGWSDGSHAAA
jgi:hypothetical protein